MTWRREKMGKYSNTTRYILTGLFLLLFAIVATGFILPDSARAEEEGYGPGTDKWKFQLGVFFPAIETDLTVGAGDLEINLEDIFDLDDNEAVARLDGYWRFAKKHRLGFGYYRLSREKRTALLGDVEIDGETWYAGALIDSDIDLDFYSISYAYSFYQGEKWEMSGILGAYWVRASLELELAAAIDPPGPDGPYVAGDQFQSDTFEGPLPWLGLGFEYYITPKWLATFKGGYFQLTINDYEGKILNLGAKLEYQFTKRWGLGLGYDGFRLNVKADDGEGFAEVDYSYHGVQVFGVLRF